MGPLRDKRKKATYTVLSRDEERTLQKTFHFLKPTFRIVSSVRHSQHLVLYKFKHENFLDEDINNHVPT